MCGIAGIINFNHSEDMQGLLCDMIGLMRHRGPDAAGIYLNGPVGLAHSRLSIIDLSGGDQPIYNEDKSVWVVFNGEIFNYPELREDLKSKGHRFYTHTDTEVLVHLYEDHGTEMFKHLNGQFAFAMWDKRKETLLLGRDRMGIRPLLYFEQNGRLIFGSEIKTLFADNQVPRSLDTQTLSDIFTCWSPIGSATVFENIKQIPPAHYAQFSREGLAIHPYWSLPFKEGATEERSLSDWTNQLEALLLDAARIRLRADVPVGAYLSGGIDSTYISSLVKKKFNNKLCTFSVSFEDERFDESSYQKLAIASINTDHRNICCKDKDIGEVFPQIIWHTEVPVIRTAPAPLHRLSKLVRDSDYKVVLTGEGADEIFAGYNIFKEDKVRRFWAKQPDSKLRPRLLEKLYPYVFSEGNGKGKVFLEGFFKRGLTAIDSPVYSHMLRWQNTSQLRTFFNMDLQKKTGNLDDFVEKYVTRLPSDFMSWDHLSRAQYTESTLFLSNYLLSSQGDRMAMGNSVEGRYPFLDYRVVEFAAKIPPCFRMNGLTEKFVLKNIARNFIPHELIDRPKQPYRAPISHCFFSDSTPDYVEELFSEKAIKAAGYFNPKKVRRLISKCRKQGGNLLSERENMAIVGILSTQLVDHMFIKNFPFQKIIEPKDVKVYH